jgi:hypothetical protein
VAQIARLRALTVILRKALNGIIHPSQCINLPVPSLEFVLAASWDDAPLGRNNIIKAGPKQELKK